MSYPILYAADASNFFNLGLGVLKDTISCLVTEERNGVFELEMECLVDSDLFRELKVDRLIKVDTAHNLKDQRFKISRISKSIDDRVKIYGEHVSYLTEDLALKPFIDVKDRTGQGALDVWGQHIIGSHPFTFYSNIMTINSTSWDIQDMENPRKALGGVSGSILDKWGGEYQFDNYHIRLMSKRGINCGALLAYGRNLTDLVQEEMITSIYTSIYPYMVVREGDGEEQVEKVITLPEYVLDSEYVGNYAKRKIMLVNFTEEGMETLEQLRTKALAYMKSNNFGIPKVSLEVSFLDLQKTLDYKDSAAFEEINLCDTVPVRFEKLGINTNAKVVKTVWNVLLDQYESITIGELRTTLSDTIRDIEEKADEAINSSNNSQNSADGKNTIFYGPDEPIANRVGDLWYKPNGDDTELYIWNGTMWEFIMSTKGSDEIKNLIEELENDLAAEKERMNDALAQAATDRENAGFTASKVDIINAQLPTIESNINGLRVSVGNKADIAQVTLLANQLHSTIQSVNGHTSKITQLSTDINLRATKEEVNNLIKADKTLLDTRNTNQPPSWYYSNYPKREVRELKYRTVMGISVGIATFGRLVTDVPWTDNTGGAVIQTFDNSDGTFQRCSVSNTTWGAWAQIADSSNVISQINISPEAILIESKLIHLSGRSKIDDAVITSAMIANLRADKITAGTLNAANVNIINMNASNIVTGRLNAIDIVGSTITGGSIYGTTISGSIFYMTDKTSSNNSLVTINKVGVYVADITDTYSAHMSKGIITIKNNKTNVGTTITAASIDVQGIKAQTITSNRMEMNWFKCYYDAEFYAGIIFNGSALPSNSRRAIACGWYSMGGNGLYVCFGDGKWWKVKLEGQ